MKITAQEEYGLRCLLRLARAEGEHAALTIPEIAAAEGLSVPYVAKLLAVLRQAGLIESARGRAGGYRFAGTPEEVAEATRACIRAGGGQRHIVNLNHGVDKDTPVATVSVRNTPVKEAATSGFLRAHFAAFSSRPTGRAWMGLRSRKRRRSSPSSAAVR